MNCLFPPFHSLEFNTVEDFLDFVFVEEAHGQEVMKRVDDHIHGRGTLGRSQNQVQRELKDDREKVAQQKDKRRQEKADAKAKRDQRKTKRSKNQGSSLRTSPPLLVGKI